MKKSDSGKTGGHIGTLAMVGIAVAGFLVYRHLGRRHALLDDVIVIPCDDEMSVYMVGEDEPVVAEPESGVEEAGAVAADPATADEAGGEPAPPTEGEGDGTPGPARRNSLRDIGGIAPAHADTLAGLGLVTTADLLQVGADPKGREDLATSTGISKKLILRWVNQADLFRIKGVGEQYADLLEAAGVDTVPELAHRRADNLTRKMVEVNEDKQLVRRTPTESQVAGWIESAKGLPRVVTY